MTEIQLSEAFKCLEDVDDKIFEDIKAPKLLKEGYVKRSEGKCLCSFDEENWEECSEEEFIELKDGGYEDLTEDEPEPKKVTESIKIDIRDDNQVSLAQKLINMKKELEADSPEEVVDLKASTDEEAQETSHEGQIKLTCKTCGTSIFLKQDEVEFDLEDPETVNKEFKECPYCHNSSGWKIEGKVVENDGKSEEEPGENDEIDSDLDELSDENLDDKPKLDKDEDEIDLSEDVEILKFNEKRFDNMINQYLNEVYDNIDSYRTTDGTVDDESNKILIEGIIKFKSGKETDTKFLFEAKNIDVNGRIKFVGLNESFSKSKFAFSLQGAVINNQLFCTRLDYDYRPLITSLNESAKDSMIRVTGKIAYKRK